MISANKWVTRAMTCEVTGRKLRSHCDYPLVAHLTVADLICHHLSKQPGVDLKNRACVFSYIMLLQYLIRIASSVTVSVTLQNKKQTPQGRGNLTGRRSGPPFTLHCHKIRGCFKMEIQDATWSSWLWRQSGESTVDDVTTRQTRQKVARNMFLPGAYKLLPGFSSPRPSAVMLPSNSQTAQTTLQHTHNMYYKTFALRHANTHWCTHLSASVAPIVQKKMCTDPTEDFHALSLWSTHTYTHTHNLITSVEAGVGF